MEILLWPNPVLKRVCEPVAPTDPDFRNQLDAMKKVMTGAGGLGLAANQVGILKRMLVAVDDDGHPRAFVNPRLVGSTGTWKPVNEGCLSLPGVFLPHRRNTRVIVEFQDTDTGALVVEEYQGRLGHILQHELDHLDGRLMIDGLPGARRDQIRAHMKTLRRR
jgi:peptide deformylase